MINWDSKALRERFLSLAIEAEQYAQAPRTDASKNESYRRVHDETLVVSYIGRHLNNEIFLGSKQALVHELKNMLAMEFRSPRAFDHEKLQSMFLAEVRRLLKEFDLRGT